MLFYQISTVVLSLLTLTLGVKLNKRQNIILKLEKSINILEQQLILSKTKQVGTIVIVEKISDSNTDIIQNYASILGIIFIISIVILGVIYISDSTSTSSQNIIMDQINKTKTLSVNQPQQIAEINSKINEGCTIIFDTVQEEIAGTKSISAYLIASGITSEYKAGQTCVLNTILENSEINSLVIETLSNT